MSTRMVGHAEEPMFEVRKVTPGWHHCNYCSPTKAVWEVRMKTAPAMTNVIYYCTACFVRMAKDCSAAVLPTLTKIAKDICHKAKS